MIPEPIVNGWLDDLFGDGAWLQAHTDDPGDGTANAVDADRVLVMFAAASGRSISSLSADGITPPDDATWTHFTFWNAETDGTLVWSDRLLTSVPAKSGRAVVLDAGALVLSIA